MQARTSHRLACLLATFLAAVIAGCSDQADPQAAVNLKIGSPPSVARRELGKARFEFKALAGNDQYYCESRQVGYAGNFLFLYKNGQFIKICQDRRGCLLYSTEWQHLANSVIWVRSERPALKITAQPPPKSGPMPEDERRFIWEIVVPIMIIETPVMPAILTWDLIHYESTK